METVLTTTEKTKNPREALHDYFREIGLEGSTAEQRLAFIEKATPEGFMETANAVHRIVAPNATQEHHPEQMKLRNPQGEVTGYAAKPGDRMAIVDHALTDAKAVVAKYRIEGGSVQNALDRSGNLAAYALGLAHFWDDGSGRTQRAMAHVIRYGIDPGESEKNGDLQMVSASRPTEGFRINSYVPEVEGANERPMDFLDTVAALDVPLDAVAYAEATRNRFSVPYSPTHGYAG